MKEKLKKLYKEIDSIDPDSTVKFEVADRFQMKVEKESMMQLVLQKEKILLLIRSSFTDIDFYK